MAKTPYPPAALKNRQQGRITLRVLFNSNGRVEKVAILENTCSRVLVENTLAWAVTNWRMTTPRGFKGGYVDVPAVYQIH